MEAIIGDSETGDIRSAARSPCDEGSYQSAVGLQSLELRIEAAGTGLGFLLMRPRTGELLHFSEDPHIADFVPHVARTAADPTPYIWAVNAAQAPSYWFPRQCPRAMAWVTGTTTEVDRQRILGPHADRVHMIEYAWLHSMQTAQIFAYRFEAAEFTPYGNRLDPHAFVAQYPVHLLAPAEPIGNLLALHEEAGIELRLANSLWPWWHAAIATSVGFSGIRLRNAARQPERGDHQPGSR